MKKAIFTTLAIGLIGLVGFAYAYQPKKQANQVNAVATQKQKAITSDYSQIIGSNKIYYAVAKDYNNNGANTWWNGSDLTNTCLLSTSAYASSSYYVSLDINIIKSGQEYQSGQLVIKTKITDLEGTRLRECYVNTNQALFIFDKNSGFVRSNCAFVFSNVRYTYDDPTGQHIEYFFKLFDVYTLDSGTFTFNQQINYYAPYNQDIDTYFVNDSDMTSASSSSVKTLLENTPFYSGGLAFDTIRVRYFSAQALSYYDDNGNRTTWTASGFASYSWIEYVNSATNRVIVVNQRITQAWNEGNSSGLVQMKGSKWVSTEYQRLTFFKTPIDTQITSLSILNNSSYQANTFVPTNVDIGLGSAFSLIGQAFTSWLPILSVSVLPGISLGLLIFLPLVAGIIILIIWIVKR